MPHTFQNQPPAMNPHQVEVLFAHYKELHQQARTNEERILLAKQLAYYSHLRQRTLN